MDREQRRRERQTRSDPQDLAARDLLLRARRQSGAEDRSSRLNVTDLSFAPRRRLVVATRGNIEWWTPSGAFIKAWPAPRGFRNAMRRVAVSPDGAFIAVSNWGAPLAILDAEGQPRLRYAPKGPELIASAPTEEPPIACYGHTILALRFESESSLLVFAREGGVHRLDLASGGVRNLAHWTRDGLRLAFAAALSTRRREALAIQSRSPPEFPAQILRYGWESGRETQANIPEDAPLSPYVALLSAALAPEDDRLFVGHKHEIVARLDLDEAGAIRKVRDFPPPKASAAPGFKGPERTIALAHDPEEEEVYAVNVAGDLTVYDAEYGLIRRHFPACFPRGYDQSGVHHSWYPGLAIEPSPIDGAFEMVSEFAEDKGRSGRECEPGERVLALDGEPFTEIRRLYEVFNGEPRTVVVTVEREGREVELLIPSGPR